MKRTLLALAVVAAAALPATPAVAATDLPRDVTLRDARNDVDKFKGTYGVAKVSHPFDIYRVRARTTNRHLIVTVAFDDLTRYNTKTYQRADGWWTMNGMMQVEVYLNGTWKYAINRRMEDQYQSGASLQKIVRTKYGPQHSGNDLDCSPGDTSMRTGVGQKIDVARDKWTYRVPLQCTSIKRSDRIKVSVQASLDIDGVKYSYYDAVSKTRAFTIN
jgi:hypothetical protein